MKSAVIVAIVVLAAPLAVQAEPGWADAAQKLEAQVVAGAKEVKAPQSGFVAAVARVTDIYLGRTAGGTNTVFPIIRRIGEMNVPAYHRDVATLASFALRAARGRPIEAASRDDISFSAGQLLRFAESGGLQFSGDAAKEAWTESLEEILAAVK
ncbi:MAG: hypothetical protein HY926_13240 [Elusimicrobia bacterium]|nr:hypothetical protein [Elusimicrobiota bacterium]